MAAKNVTLADLLSLNLTMSLSNYSDTNDLSELKIYQADFDQFERKSAKYNLLNETLYIR